MRNVLKGVVIVLGVGVALLVLAAATLYARGGSRMTGVDAMPAETLVPPEDAASIVWGAYLVQTHACSEGHGADLSGRVVVDAPAVLHRRIQPHGRGGRRGRDVCGADWERPRVAARLLRPLSAACPCCRPAFSPPASA
jgi:hypothetical protein